MRAPSVDEFLHALARASIGDFSSRLSTEDKDPTDPLTHLAVALNILLGDLQYQQEQLREASVALERKVRERTRELRAANDALRRTNESLEAFSYVVSHDLKEPVRGILALTDALKDANSDEERREAVRTLDEAAIRLDRMVEGLLEFSRAALHARFAPEAVLVADALGDPECRGRFADALVRRGARLEVEPGPQVLASRAALHQLLGNLVLNAILHNPKDQPHVRVRTVAEVAPGMHEVRVEDDGPGFTDAMLRIFARLQGERPRTMRGGFGLAIARRAAEHMGGQMTLDRSADLGGAAVRVRLPAAGATATARPPPVLSGAGPGSA